MSQTDAYRFLVIEPIKNNNGKTVEERISRCLADKELGDMYLIVSTRTHKFLVWGDTDALDLAATMYFAKLPQQLGIYHKRFPVKKMLCPSVDPWGIR